MTPEMRFAYADPPYPGQSKRLYGDHPDFAGEVDHETLIARLVGDYPDGWALSTSVEAFREVLILCPSDVRVAIWNVTNRRPFSGAGRWHQSWEPVIVRGGRPQWGAGPLVRDLLTCGAIQGGANLITGQKPPSFGRWIFDLLGAQPDDTLDDIFPGSGAISREWAAFQAQESLALRYSHTRKRSGWVPRDWPMLDGETG